MKKILILTVALILVASTSSAVNFSPTLLKITADPVIQYNFDGSKLEIPIQVSGTNSGIIFSVYTKGKAAGISPNQNGYLGWHYVNKVDTCIYYSSLRNFSAGKSAITWEGKNQDGAVVPPGDYTYYLWAFDNQSAKLKMMNFWRSYSRGFTLQEKGENGLPLANPIYMMQTKRWVVGNDPLDSLLVESCNITLASGWGRSGDPCLQPDNFSLFYIEVGNKDSGTSGIQKLKWVPSGTAEVQTDFGDEGYSDLFTSQTGADYGPGVKTNGTYFYTAKCAHFETEPHASFYIYDYDGAIISECELTQWWSEPDALAAGAQMNGGPNQFDFRNGFVFLNSHANCTKHLVDPIRYLDSGQELDELTVWVNGNGDYVLDHNFEETAALRWICNDYNVGPYAYNISADNNLFSVVNAYDVGAVSFGLMGPDGTGIGYFAFAGETAGWKKASWYIDSGCAYDGMYCDNEQAGGTHYQEGGWKANEYTTGTYFIGHDSITGTITSAVSVEENAPAAFSVAQNSPNPFNPTTTISFSIAQAGNVAVEVYNVAGQKVDTLADGFMDAGSHSVVWDASGFSAGVYFYTVKTGGFSRTMKMTLLK